MSSRSANFTDEPGDPDACPECGGDTAADYGCNCDDGDPAAPAAEHEDDEDGYDNEPPDGYYNDDPGNHGDGTISDQP